MNKRQLTRAKGIWERIHALAAEVGEGPEHDALINAALAMQEVIEPFKPLDSGELEKIIGTDGQ